MSTFEVYQPSCFPSFWKSGHRVYLQEYKVLTDWTDFREEFKETYYKQEKDKEELIKVGIAISQKYPEFVKYEPKEWNKLLAYIAKT